ncbi:MAG: hypothetical protein HC900_08705 [Methylacidiphilales bacterium]|nr:hypothetical protein [Candidatus Methylacidiphilales bacterium]
MRASLAAILGLPLMVFAGGPAVADWTPVQLGPGGPIIEQDWGLYRPGHGSPRILDGPILMPVPRPIGMAEPMRRYYEKHYYRRGVMQAVPPNDGIVRKDTPPALPQSGMVEGGWAAQGWAEPTWRHYFPGGLEDGDRPARSRPRRRSRRNRSSACGRRRKCRTPCCRRRPMRGRM